MKNKVLRNMLIPGIVAVAAVIIPAILIEINVIDGYTAQIITLGGINAILAISVNVISGITGQLSLGQAGFQALGAYSVILLTANAHIPLPVSSIRELPAHGRGTCARCKKENIKVLYETEIDGAKVKVCKFCNAAIKNSK